MRKTSTLILSLLAAMLLSTSVNAQVFFTEDFEGTPNMTTMLPTNWTESTNSTDGGWNIGNATSATSSYLTWPAPTNGTNFAYTNDDACNCTKDNDRMFLPVQNFSTYTTIAMTFDLYLNGTVTEFGHVVVSTNMGVSYDTVYTAPANAGAWQDGINVSLSAYAGQSSVVIGFVYNDNGTWSYGMGIDDVSIAQLASAEDLQALAAGGEYTQIPLPQVSAMQLEAVVTNSGATNATDAIITTRVLSSSNGFTTPLQTTSSTPAALNVNDTTTFNSGTFTPMAPATYIFQHIVSSSLVDGIPTNDTVEYMFDVTAATFARDDSVITIGLGINGTGNTSTLGVNYTFDQPAVIGSVTFGFTGVVTGDSTEVVIYNTDATGAPTTPIDSVLYIMANDGPTVETASFPSGVSLAAGEYFFGLKEFTSVNNAGLMGSDNIFTPNTGWGSVNGGAYATIESLNFTVTFLVRPNLAPPCTNTSNTAAVSICQGDVYTIGNSMYSVAGTYVDTLMAPGGCDSIVTTNLTVNALPTVTLMGLAATYCDTDSAVALTGTPAGGTFSGPGVSNGIFDPNTAGVGMHDIIYSYTDSLTQCSASDTMSTDVSICIGLEDGIAGVSITPNPNNGQFKLNGLTPGMEYKIFDLQGKMILSKTAQFANEAVIMEERSAGLYFLQLTLEGESKQLKIVVE